MENTLIIYPIEIPKDNLKIGKYFLCLREEGEKTNLNPTSRRNGENL